jgi:hypothetical protein
MQGKIPQTLFILNGMAQLLKAIERRFTAITATTLVNHAY